MKVSVQTRRRLACAIAASMVFGSLPAGAQTYELRQPLQGVVTPATAANVAASPGSVSFATLELGQHASQVVTFTNSGGTAAPTAPSLPAAPFLAVNNCGESLAPGGSCGVTVAYSPTAAGEHVGSLTFAGVTVGITGNAVMPSPTVAVTGWQGAAPDGDFGSRTINAGGTDKYFYVRNEGSYGALEAGFTLEGSSAFSVLNVDAVDRTNDGWGVTCASSTATSRSGCTLADPSTGYYAKKDLRVLVRFAPTAAGPQSGKLTFTHNGGAGSPTAINLTGTGAEISPTVAVTGWGGAAPNGVFTSKVVGNYSEQYFYLQNTGNQGRIISDVAVTGAGFSIVEAVAVDRVGELTSAGCGGSGNALTKCTMADSASGYFAKQNLRVKVRFSPTAVTGFTGKLTFTHNGTGTASPVSIDLSGSGIEVQPQVALTDQNGTAVSGLAFGSVNAGAYKEMQVFLRNQGSQGAIKAGVSLAGDSRFTIVRVDAVDRYSEGWGATCAASTASSRTDCQLQDSSVSWTAKMNLRVTVRFTNTPSLAGAAVQGSLTFTHNGTGVASPVTIPVSGTGL